MSDNLLYASLKNQITDIESLEELNKEFQPTGFLPVNTNLSLSKQILDDTLKYFNIKRACCLQVDDPNNNDAYIVNVLTDAPNNHVYQNTPLGRFYKNQKKIDRYISVPKDLCKSDFASTDPKSSKCQNLYATYCGNMMQQYNKINGSLDDFEKFRPECGCYIPLPDYIKQAGLNPPKVCISKHCEKKKGIFLDQVSANPSSNCALTLCNASSKYNDIKGRDVTIDNKVQQVCGGTLVNNQFNNPVTIIPSYIENIIKKTPIDMINNYVSNGTLYLSYGLLLSSSLLMVIFIIIIIVLIIFATR